MVWNFSSPLVCKWAHSAKVPLFYFIENGAISFVCQRNSRRFNVQETFLNFFVSQPILSIFKVVLAPHNSATIKLFSLSYNESWYVEFFTNTGENYVIFVALQKCGLITQMSILHSCNNLGGKINVKWKMQRPFVFSKANRCIQFLVNNPKMNEQNKTRQPQIYSICCRQKKRALILVKQIQKGVGKGGPQKKIGKSAEMICPISFYRWPSPGSFQENGWRLFFLTPSQSTNLKLAPQLDKSQKALETIVTILTLEKESWKALFHFGLLGSAHLAYLY